MWSSSTIASLIHERKGFKSIKKIGLKAWKNAEFFPPPFSSPFPFGKIKKEGKKEEEEEEDLFTRDSIIKQSSAKWFLLSFLSLYLTVQYPVFSAGSLPKEYSIISLSLPLCVFAVIAHFFFCFKYLCLIFRWLGHSRVRVFLTSVSLESQCLQTSTVWERKKRRKRKSVQYKLCSHQTHCRPRLMLCILYVSDPDSGDPFPISLSHYSASNPSRERCR